MKISKAKIYSLLSVVTLLSAMTVSAAPRLTVVVAIDGFHQSDMLAMRNYWPTGGLRTLQEEAFQTELSLPNIVYGGAETPATLFCGAVPAEHGITYDKYFSRTDRALHDVFEDNEQNGIGCALHVSPKALLSLTAADRFRLNYGEKAKIYAIGLDANTTLCMAGHSANACCWYDDTEQHWATTTYYTEGLPSAADAQNTSGRIAELAAREWTPRMDIAQYMRPTEDEKKKGFAYTGLQNGRSPYINTLVTELALSMQKESHLGEDATPDLLFLQMTVQTPKATADRIGTAEQEDMYLHLNQDLGYLIEQLDKRIGKQNIQLLLTGLPRLGTSAEIFSHSGVPRKAFNVDRAVALTGTYLMALYGHERWVDGGHGQSIYLNRILIEQKKLPLLQIQRQVSDFLLDFEGVQGACPSSVLLQTSGTPETKRLQQSISKRTAGDVVFWLEENRVSEERNNVILDKVIDRSPLIPLYLWSGALRQYPDKHDVNALSIYNLLFE